MLNNKLLIARNWWNVPPTHAQYVNDPTRSIEAAEAAAAAAAAVAVAADPADKSPVTDIKMEKMEAGDDAAADLAKKGF